MIGVSDNSGAEITSLRYTPYGNSIVLAGSFIPDFGFTGYFLHKRSGMNLTRFRAYNPNLGRWLTRDPSDSPSSSNLYGYVENNPVCFFDPYGLAKQKCCYDPAQLARDDKRIDLLYRTSLRMYNNNTSPFIDMYQGQVEATRAGNIIDRTFKFLVDRDPSLRHNGLHTTVIGEEGPDVITQCKDIFWEVTTTNSWPDHKARFLEQKYEFTDRTPEPNLYHLQKARVVF